MDFTHNPFNLHINFEKVVHTVPMQYLHIHAASVGVWLRDLHQSVGSDLPPGDVILVCYEKLL